MAIENKIWLTPNFVALCHSVGNRVLTDFMMPCLFMYFATVLSPEYLVMLFPVNEALTTYLKNLYISSLAGIFRVKASFKYQCTRGVNKQFSPAIAFTYKNRTIDTRGDGIKLICSFLVIRASVNRNIAVI